MFRTEKIDGHDVWCSRAGVLVVDSKISVLPRGTHAALDQFGKSKERIVAWWKTVR